MARETPTDAELQPLLPDLGFSDGCRQGLGEEVISARYFGPAHSKDAIYVFGHGRAKIGVTGIAAGLFAFRDYLSAPLAHVEGEIKAGNSKQEIVKLENLAGFPDHHVSPGRGNRLPSNLAVAFVQLTSG